MNIRSAIILAAGLGLRMRPITETVPKPLIEVAGRPLIAYGLAALKRAGIENIVVNVHHLAEKLEGWLARSGHDVVISDERGGLLDSGGAILQALPNLGDGPFVVINADTFWLDEGPTCNLTRLMSAYDPKRMDMLLLLVRPDRAAGHEGKGDFTRAADGRLERYRGTGEPLIYAGALVMDPAAIGSGRPPKFSLNLCFDDAIARGRLFGIELDGIWLTVGTPKAIADVEASILTYRLNAAC